MPQSQKNVSAHLQDVCLVTTSPFRSDDIGAVDAGAIHRNLDFVAEQGIRTIFPCGNTGEFQTLSTDECRTIVRETVAAVGDDLCVIAGIGHSGPTALAMARQAADTGADAVMLVPTSFTFESPDGLRRYYLEILDQLPLPAVLYKRAATLSDAVLAELARHERVAGIKYAVNDLDAFRTLVQTVGPACSVVWMCGTAERWAPFYYLAGARGFSSGMANFIPRKSLALRDALNAADWNTAMEIRELFVPFERLRALHNNANNVPAVKYAMDRTGLYGGPSRLPLTDLSEADAREADRLVRELSLMAS